MFTDLKRHPIAYIVLLLMLAGCIGAFLSFWPNRVVLRGVTVVMVLGYFLWGVFVHKSAGHLNKEIVKEYALVALLGGVALLMLTT